MKQQVVVVHGGTAFENYDDFLEYLKSSEIELDWLKSRVGWKRNLQKDLGENYDVILAEMPNKDNAKYLEWAVYFNKLLPYLDEEIILIGHSLGGIFLAKYLSENEINKKIKSLILVAAPFDGVNEEESLGDFILGSDLSLIEKQSDKIFLIQSKDDNVVGYEEVLKYKKVLSKAELINFEDRGHFGQDNFKELIDLIKRL